MVIDTLQTSTSQARLKFADFFAGIGLVRKGLEPNGWQCVFANDIDGVKGNIYAKNFGRDYLKIDDIANLHASDIPDVTLITASFACQDLSLTGNMKRLAREGIGTFFEFTRILGELATESRLPSVVLIENTTEILTTNNGNDIRKVVLSLNQLGYACDVLVLDAVHFLPQSRPHLFIIGFKLSEFKETMRTLSNPGDIYLFQHACRPASVQKAIAANSDLSWNFLDLSPLPSTSEVVLADLVENSDNLQWFGEKELVRELSFTRALSKERLEKAKRLANVTHRTVYLTAYRQMREALVCLETRDDGIADCLRTASGGSSRQILIVVSPYNIQMRYMTAREYGRLQGVEDRFWIPQNQNIGRFVFGDAVAVPVVAWLGCEIKRNLKFNPQRRNVLDDITKMAG